jgi:hypothetical protein
MEGSSRTFGPETLMAIELSCLVVLRIDIKERNLVAQRPRERVEQQALLAPGVLRGVA